MFLCFFFRNVLASGSADETVILWDMQECRCVHALKHHKDKVCFVNSALHNLFSVNFCLKLLCIFLADLQVRQCFQFPATFSLTSLM